jgi:hypothetical protein
MNRYTLNKNYFCIWNTHEYSWLFKVYSRNMNFTKAGNCGKKYGDFGGFMVSGGNFFSQFCPITRAQNF